MKYLAKVWEIPIVVFVFLMSPLQASDNIFIGAGDTLDFDTDVILSFELDDDHSAVVDSLKTAVDMKDFDLPDDTFDDISPQGYWWLDYTVLGHPSPFAYLLLGNNGTGGNLGMVDLAGRHFRRIPITNKAIAARQLDRDTVIYLADEPSIASFRSFSVWTVKIDGSVQRKIIDRIFRVWPTGADRLHVHHSPDGSAAPVAYFSAFDTLSTSEIFKIDFSEPALAETVFVHAEVNTFMDRYDPALSPDGKKLLISADQVGSAGDHQIWLDDIENGTLAVLSGDFAADPVWHPDGNRFLYTQATESTYGLSSYSGDIISVKADGTNPINLTQTFPSIAGKCRFPFVISFPEFSEFKILHIERDAADMVDLAWSAERGKMYTVETSETGADWSEVVAAKNILANFDIVSTRFQDSDTPGKIYRIAEDPDLQGRGLMSAP